MSHIWFVILAFLIIIIIILGKNIRVVPQAQTFIIERLGKYAKTWTAGLNIKAPFIDKVAKKVDMREQVYDFVPQNIITKDNVSLSVDSIVFAQVVDPRLFAYGVASPVLAIEKLTATTMRNILGELTLDDALTSRDYINGKMQAALDAVTASWGIKVNRVELRSIDPPAQIKDAMEKQMRAERERREKILLAEGAKESEILRAEGEKKGAILRAEADKESAVLRAEAEKRVRILEAEGKAEGIRAVQTAEADAIKLVKAAAADDAVLKLRGFEAFVNAANGTSNTMIIPSDIANLAGVIGSLAEVAKNAPSAQSDAANAPPTAQ